MAAGFWAMFVAVAVLAVPARMQLIAAYTVVRTMIVVATLASSLAFVVFNRE